MTLPLQGTTIIELQGLGPGPYAGMLLADMGAEVILVRRPGPVIPSPHDRGKLAVTLDLRTDAGVRTVLDLCEHADALFEGLRPGVAERLGVGPEAARARNPKLVYGRVTGWGQTGPWAEVAGHDLNYISITGALAAMGEKGRPPMPPLNFVGDYAGGSLFLVSGMLAALLRAERTGKGSVVDAAMIDGVNSMMSVVHLLHGLKRWSTERESHLIDGGMPFYRCYVCADGRYIAVACLEPQFYALFLQILDLDPAVFGGQGDPALHPAQHARLEALFATEPRDHWAELFAGTDACVTPVLDYLEAPDHLQNRARGGLRQHGPFVHPRPAPVFDGMLRKPDTTVPDASSGLARVSEIVGYEVGL